MEKNNKTKKKKEEERYRSGSIASCDLSPGLPVSSRVLRAEGSMPAPPAHLLILSPRGHTPLPSPHHLHLLGQLKALASPVLFRLLSFCTNNLDV